MNIVESSRELPVKGAYDVLVIGGGVAGVSAALASARQGMKVCLVEKEYMLGGLATAGIIAIYLPLCDGKGQQLISGISEELLKESIKYGSGKIPDCWCTDGDLQERSQNRYKLRFDPPAFAYALDRIIVDNDIDLILGTSFSKVVAEENEITYCIFENREGRFALQAKMYVDATGDAMVAYDAGEATTEYKKNRLAGWYYSYDGEEYKLNIVQESLKIPEEQVSHLYGGIENRDVTEFCLESRKMAVKHAMESEKKRIITQIASIPQIRMTRRLKGKFELSETDDHKAFDDSVGYFGDWRKAGPVFGLPYSTLVGKTNNLIIAGRCISAEESAGDIVRAIPVCALSGEVAGTASALKIKHHMEAIQQMDISELREVLKENNNIVDLT